MGDCDMTKVMLVDIEAIGIMSLSADTTFKLMFHLNPRKWEGIGDVFNAFFGDGKDDKTNPFLGGNGDFRRTLHERIYALLFPRLERQVVFGTGKNGYDTYGTKRYVVDFYDPHNKIVYEIDGPNHKDKHHRTVDSIKRCFFYLKHQIEVVRLTNKEVEQELMRALEGFEKEGCLRDRVSELMENAS
jgi:hypothetical protein